MNLKEFVNPPKQYRPSPFWSWNDVIDPIEMENRYYRTIIQGRSPDLNSYLLKDFDLDDWRFSELCG